jgi:putative peptidoglycan lipid II flippase
MTVDPEIRASASTNPPAPEPPKQGGVMKSSAIFSGLTLISRFVGFARDIAINAVLGASVGPAADAYNTALSFPNLFRRIFAEGAFAAAFVPAYAKTLRLEGEEAADRVATDAIAVIAVATLVLTLIAQLTMPWLMMAINIGFLDDPARYNLAVILTQITMPYLPCMAIAALLSGVLNARGRFIVSGAYPILMNVIMLTAILTSRGGPVAAAYAVSWGVLIAGVAQAALCFWAVRKAGANIRFRIPRLTAPVKAIIITAIPAVIGNSATQINVFISGNLASFVEGGRSWLATADRLYQLPLGLVGVAIGIALLPKLSSAVATGDREQQQASMDEALVLAMSLTLPAATAILAMPHFLIDGLFTRNNFLAFDAINTAQVLFHFGWGVPAFILIRILTPAFFSRQDTRTPMRFALISVAVNAVIALGLFAAGVGVPGIAAATSAAAWVNAGLLAITLWRQDFYRPAATAWRRLSRILIASLAMGAVLFVAVAFRAQIEAPIDALLGHGAKEIALILTTAVGGLLYLILLFVTQAVTIGEVRGLIRRERKS